MFASCAQHPISNLGAEQIDIKNRFPPAAFYIGHLRVHTLERFYVNERDIITVNGIILDRMEKMCVYGIITFAEEVVRLAQNPGHMALAGLGPADVEIGVPEVVLSLF